MACIIYEIEYELEPIYKDEWGIMTYQIVPEGTNYVYYDDINWAIKIILKHSNGDNYIIDKLKYILETHYPTVWQAILDC